MRVWLCHCLCPNGHSILATGGEADDIEAAALFEKILRKVVGIFIRDGVISPWCKTCGSWHETWEYGLRQVKSIGIQK